MFVPPTARALSHLGEAPPVRLERTVGQLGDVGVARGAAHVVQKGLDAGVDRAQMLIQQTRLLAVDAEKVRGHVQSAVLRGRRHVEALRRQLDGDDLIQRGRVERGVLPALREAHVALHDGFVRGGNHLLLLLLLLLCVVISEKKIRGCRY